MEKKEFIHLVQNESDETSPAALHYWNIYQKHENSLFFFKINFPSLLIGYWWFLYRRMYLFFIAFFCFSGLIDLFFIEYFKIMKGAHTLYTMLVLHPLLALIANPLYMWFIEKNAYKQKKIGTHVRLFLPFVMLWKHIFVLLLIQLIGIHLNVNFLITTIYPFLLAVFIFAAINYVYMFYNWAYSD